MSPAFRRTCFLEGLFFHSWHAFWRYGWKKKGEDWRRRLGQGSSGIRVWGLVIACQCHCRLAPNKGLFELWCQGVNRIYPNLAFFKDSFCFKFQQSIDFDSFWGLTILTHKHIRHHQNHQTAWYFFCKETSGSVTCVLWGRTRRSKKDCRRGAPTGGWNQKKDYGHLMRDLNQPSKGNP